jgi:hypothetical protein
MEIPEKFNINSRSVYKTLSFQGAIQPTITLSKGKSAGGAC